MQGLQPRQNPRPSPFEFREEYIGPRGAQDDFTLFAYDREGRVVGYAEYSVYGDELFVEALDLRPTHRRRGLGRLMVTEASALHPEAGTVNLAWETPEGQQLMENPDATLRILDHRRRVIDELPLDTARMDIGDPRVRELLFTAVMGQADQGAASLEFVQGGETLDTIRFKDFDLVRRDGKEQFHDVFFQALDDVAPPPRSGTRERYSLNARSKEWRERHRRMTKAQRREEYEAFARSQEGFVLRPTERGRWAAWVMPFERGHVYADTPQGAVDALSEQEGRELSPWTYLDREYLEGTAATG